MSEEEFDELLDLMSENNLTQHGADTLYGKIVSRGINARLEIERLNNIINELEKEFDKELESLGYREEKLYTQGIHDTIINHKYKLQELKERS